MTTSHTTEYKYDSGGVLFYAGFDGTRDAESKGNGAAVLKDGGGLHTSNSAEAVRGDALHSGERGHVEYTAPGNVLSEEGTVEMWILEQINQNRISQTQKHKISTLAR